MATKHLAQGGLAVSMSTPVTTDGDFNSGSMFVNNAQGVFIVISSTHAAGDATTFTLREDDGSATWSAITANIWASEDVATTAITRSANANNYITDANATNKIIIFRLDQDSMTAGYDRVRVAVTGSTSAGNFASIVGYHLPARYS